MMIPSSFLVQVRVMILVVKWSNDAKKKLY